MHVSSAASSGSPAAGPRSSPIMGPRDRQITTQGSLLGQAQGTPSRPAAAAGDVDTVTSSEQLLTRENASEKKKRKQGTSDSSSPSSSKKQRVDEAGSARRVEQFAAEAAGAGAAASDSDEEQEETSTTTPATTRRAQVKKSPGKTFSILESDIDNFDTTRNVSTVEEQHCIKLTGLSASEFVSVFITRDNNNPNASVLSVRGTHAKDSGAVVFYRPGTAKENDALQYIANADKSNLLRGRDIAQSNTLFLRLNRLRDTVTDFCTVINDNLDEYKNDMAELQQRLEEEHAKRLADATDAYDRRIATLTEQCSA
jgi:hypothetical protein